MKNFFKNKGVTALVLTATIILAVIAILTAVRLYQLREEPVTPTVPEQPSAEEPKACTELTFTLTTPTPTTTATPSATVTSTPTEGPTSTPTEGPTSTPTEGPTSTPTEGPTSTPTAAVTSISRASPTSTPTTAALPAAGISLPTLLGFGIGVLLITLALILAI